MFMVTISVLNLGFNTESYGVAIIISLKSVHSPSLRLPDPAAAWTVWLFESRRSLERLGKAFNKQAEGCVRQTLLTLLLATTKIFLKCKSDGLGHLAEAVNGFPLTLG